MGVSYTEVLRRYYDALYHLNIGVDLIDGSKGPLRLEDYAMIVVPGLYAAPDSLLRRLNDYVKAGGHVVYTFKSGFSDQYVKVRSTIQPGVIGEACGIRYSQFTTPDKTGLTGNLFQTAPADN
jgi:beta-galactosidase